MTFGRVVGIRNRAGARAAFRHPLVRAGRALRQFPFVAEQVPEEVVAPLGRRGGPGDLYPAGDGVAAFAGAVAAGPAEPLRLERRRFRFGADVRRRACAVRLAERVPAGDERHRLLVVHRHAAERLANVLRGSQGIRVAVRSLRIDVDEAHLHGGEGILELPVAAVALVVEPRGLGAPVGVVRFPDIGPSAGEAERLEPHRLEGAVAGENHQVGPRELPPVLLLDRPEQPARLVEVRVVGPAVEGREALHACPGASAAVADAVRARAVPGHPDEERPVVAVVGRPPVLRRRHHLLDVLLHGIEIERLERFGVVEGPAHGIARGRVLVEDLQVQLIRPPVAVRRAARRVARERALRFVRLLCHVRFPLMVLLAGLPAL